MKRTIVNPVIKDKATFLRTAVESNHSLSEIEITLFPGGGNELHYHKTYSETFTAIDGELGLRLSKTESVVLKPGESFTVKPMQLHCFFNPSDHEIRFNIRIEPGHVGFENTLRILYGLASDGLTDKRSLPKSLVQTAVLLRMSDMNAPGLLTFLYPLLNWISRTAKARRIEQQLMARYCVQ